MKLDIRDPKYIDVHGSDKSEAYRRYSELWNSQGGCMINIAMNLWKDAYDQLQEHRLYRQRVKQLTKQIDAAWNTMWRRMEWAFEEKWTVYCDSLNQMYAECEQDIMFLYLAVKRVLDKNFVPDSHFVATQQVALIACQHAKIVYDHFWFKEGATIRGYLPVTFQKLFSYQNPKNIYVMHKELCDYTCSTPDKDINFGGDDNCVNALVCLLRHALDEDMLERSIVKGVELQGDEYQDVLDKYHRLKKEAAEKEEAERSAVAAEEERRRMADQESEKSALLAKLGAKYKVSKRK